MSIDEHRLLNNLLDAFDRLHDGQIELVDLVALLFATRLALPSWHYVAEMTAAESDVRRIAQSAAPELDRNRRATDAVQQLRKRIAAQLRAAGPKPRHHRRTTLTETSRQQPRGSVEVQRLVEDVA